MKYKHRDVRVSTPLMSHLHHVLLGPITHLLPSTMSIQARPLMSHPHHVNSSPTAHLPPPPRLFEHNHSLLRILVFLIQILILIPDSRAVYDLIFTLFILLTLSRYSDSKNPFHTNLNSGALRAPPNTVGITLSLGGVKNRIYSWLQDRPLGHVIWFTRC